MPVEWFATANSHTLVAYDTGWLVVDIGSGHQPHPRADVLVDRFLLQTPERVGQVAVLPAGKSFVVADACALPFRDNAFDFVVCSHVAEHLDAPGPFCAELSRVGKKGYLETPSRFTEQLRPQLVHRWFVSARNGALVFERNPYCQRGPVKWYQQLFYSLYFYRTPRQLDGKRVLGFAYGCRKPWHFGFMLIRRVLVRFWLRFPSLTYTRLWWKGTVPWEMK